jgi:hypothetical protein
MNEEGFMKFKYILFLIAIALNSLTDCEAKQSNSHAPPLEGYQLVWSDEFEGDTLDLSKWDCRNLGKRRDAINVKDAVSRVSFDAPDKQCWVLWLMKSD